MATRTVQTRFSENGLTVEKKVKLLSKEVSTAFYVLQNAKTGDTLRSILAKLPIGTGFKNIRRILVKLQKIGCITMEDSVKGKRITGISKEAKEIAEEMTGNFRKYRISLNSLSK